MIILTKKIFTFLNNALLDTNEKMIKFFETALSKFKTPDGRADSRKLIMTSFKEKLKGDFLNYSE